MDVKGRLIQLADGVLVEHDVLGIVQQIQEYDPNLRIKYVQNPELGDAPYALFELCKDGIERLVFYIWKLDGSIMERIRAADNARQNVLHVIERNNESVRHQLNKRYREKLMEGNDIVVSYLKSRKGRWTFQNDKGQLVQLDDAENGKNGVIK